MSQIPPTPPKRPDPPPPARSEKQDWPPIGGPVPPAPPPPGKPQCTCPKPTGSPLEKAGFVIGNKDCPVHDSPPQLPPPPRPAPPPPQTFAERFPKGVGVSLEIKIPKPDPSPAQFPLPPLAGMEPLHSGLGNNRRSGRMAATPYDGTLLASCRCDQEAFHDSNLIQKSLRRAQRAEKELAAQRVLTIVALLLLPAAFFVSICGVIALGWSRNLIPDSIGFGIGAGLVAAGLYSPILLATRVAQSLQKRIEEKCGKGLFDV